MREKFLTSGKIEPKLFFFCLTVTLLAFGELLATAASNIKFAREYPTLLRSMHKQMPWRWLTRIVLETTSQFLVRNPRIESCKELINRSGHFLGLAYIILPHLGWSDQHLLT